MISPLRRVMIKLYIDKMADKSKWRENAFYKHLARVITVGEVDEVLNGKKQGSIFDKSKTNS